VSPVNGFVSRHACATACVAPLTKTLICRQYFYWFVQEKQMKTHVASGLLFVWSLWMIWCWFPRMPSNFSFMDVYNSSSWQDMCAKETTRFFQMESFHMCHTMEECMTNLRRVIRQRGTLANVTDVYVDNNHEFKVCTRFPSETRFCEIGYGSNEVVSKKACIASDACYAFNLDRIFAWRDYLHYVPKRMKKCGLVFRGHTVRCIHLQPLREFVMLFGNPLNIWDTFWVSWTNYRFSDVVEMVGTSHSGGVFLTHGLLQCSEVRVYGMGLYHDDDDYVYQHYYDREIQSVCPTSCWHGNTSLYNVTGRDHEFFHALSSQVCRPDIYCNTSQTTNVPVSENQEDFFIKSEIKLHLLHALGMVTWTI
jgi:hypothetical protein